LEYETITKLKIPFVELKTGRLQRSFTIHTIPSLIKIPIGFFQSFRILKKLKPDVVVGFGGYLSYPVILASHFLKIPIVIHEQTLEAGISNERLARYADKVCISFESSYKYFSKSNTVLTGNPIRKSILNPIMKNNFKMDAPIIFITGGNQGSHKINNLVMDTLPKILDVASVIHQTGSAWKNTDFNKLKILKEGLNKNKKDKYLIAKSFSPDEIGEIYSKAELVVGRSGINTVTELISLNKPGLMVPILKTQRNEQINNANYLLDLGLGVVLGKDDQNPENFIKELTKMMRNIDKYKLKSGEVPNFRDSAKKIVKIIYETSKKSSN